MMDSAMERNNNAEGGPCVKIKALGSAVSSSLS
jgi:hypothetical protein